MDFEGNEIIAADDSCGLRTMDTFAGKQREMFQPMLEQGYRYFNAGVMLLNIREIRKNHNFKTYMQAVEAWNYQMAAPDQDILNYVHWKKVGYVDYKKYDMFARIAHNRKYTYRDIKENTAIIHYAGDKPWDVCNCHFDIEQLWWDYAKKLPYYMELLQNLQYNLMMDDSLEKTMSDMIRENSELKDKVQQLLQINEKLMALLSRK
jgi:lipopolysaccharide biosynthesis glycosyltransferase